MCDNTRISATIPLQERVTRLRQYDAARTHLSFTAYHEIVLPADTRVVISSGYVIAMSPGKVTVHRPTSELRGIQPRTWSFSFEKRGEDAGIDPVQGLLAIVSSTGEDEQE